ncbi:MAG: UDP-galactopyranose mutase [Deltaproteobacteria bacterium]|nr:UDP-galactopyranose mutase [Deltaproteobacteria bacterium]
MARVLIVGAGFFGSVLAERIAEDAGLPVTVIDRREHVGGNCWSEVDRSTGVEFHKYGSHIFHTSSEEVWKYVSRFTAFNEYRHVVWTTFQNRVYSMPINLGTINAYYGKNLSPSEAHAFIQEELGRENISQPHNLEEKAVSLIGRPLYEAFIREYTIKQWSKEPVELPADIITRLPVRFSYNNRYFFDTYEGIPLEGYGKLFERLLAHDKITVRLGTDYADMAQSAPPRDTLIIWTGAIDAFFDYALGQLEWRTMDFEEQRFDLPDFQGATVMNYADAAVPYTRIHEFKHYHPEREDTGKTLIFKEYSRFAQRGDEPYYPVDTRANRELFARYQDLARTRAANVIFGGRLGNYKYYDMDDAIMAALACYRDVVVPRLRA